MAAQGPHPGLNPNNFNERVKKTQWAPKRLRDVTYLDRFLRYGKMWAAVLFSDLAYENNNNESWIPDRPLGQGGFGSVTRWCKKDSDGNAIETLAMKELEPEQDGALGFWHPGLAKEAFFQSQLTQDATESFLNLKGYRYYINERKCRLYMENARYGTLEHLRRWYRAWDTYLPEVFLWSVFHELALAIEAMEQCPGRWTPYSHEPYDQRDPTKHILHFDLKTANVFVCDRERQHPSDIFPSEYPQVKIGDFGLSELTARVDPRNPDQFFDIGDADSRTPEQRKWGERFLAADVQPIINQRYDRLQGFRFESRHNVWQVGLVMHDLMKLCQVGRLSEWLRARQTARSFTRLRAGIPRRHFMDMPSTYNQQEYSAALRNMILLCLCPDVGRRPTSAQLVADTRDNLRNRVRQGRNARRPNRQDGRARLPRVALTPAEMNRLPHGANNKASWFVDLLDANEGIEWADMRDKMFHDADQPRIQPPRPKWDIFYDNESVEEQPEAIWDAWKRFGEHVRLTDPNARPHRPQRVGSFDGAEIADDDTRAMLQRMKQAVQAFARRSPMRMVEYVLQKEKMDEVAAQQVLRWLYNRAPPSADWQWAQKEDLVRKATAVRQRGNQLWTNRECLYAVATSDFGVEQVNEAVDALKAIYNTS